MYSGKYYPWDQYPKFLRFDEIQNPLKVVIDFFSGAWPLDRRRELKQWRDFVVEGQHYKHPHGPGSLLFISDEYLKLLEACYLLSFDYSNYDLRTKDLVSEEKLASGLEEWFYFPADLSEKELRNPYRALKKVFKKYTLAQYRDYLKEWLHAALYTNPIGETMSAGEIISVFENMLRLTSTAWIIRQTESESPMLKWEISTDHKEKSLKAVDLSDPVQDLHNAISGDALVKPFSPTITPAEKLGLQQVVDLIVKQVPAVRSITYLGSHGKPFTFYLLILLDETEKTPEHSVANKIEDHCRYLTGVFAVTHKVESAVAGLKKRSRFWTTALANGIELYKTENFSLPELPELAGEEEHRQMIDSWDRWGKQGKGFFRGAVRYIEEENYNLGLFLLHQAAENTLIGVITVLIGYRQASHNLAKLLNFTLLFTDELKNTFKLNDPESARLFQLICSGYSEARYKEGYHPNGESVRAAQVIIEKLIEKAHIICIQFITGNR